jgi:hypothetical protein
VPFTAAPVPSLVPRPSAPFVVSLTGGVFIFAGGLLVLYLFLLVGSLGVSLAPYAWFVPLLGLASGPAIIALAFLFYRRPEHPAIYGSLVIGLSIVSYLSFLGGLFVGLILGVIGGALMIAWRPPVIPPGYYPTLAPYPSYRACARCGRAVLADSRFCSYCGYVFT